MENENLNARATMDKMLYENEQAMERVKSLEKAMDDFRKQNQELSQKNKELERTKEEAISEISVIKAEVHHCN